MLDDGAHGDGAAGDHVFGATVPGLFEGERLDFTIRATDGVKTSAGPSGNDTLVSGQFPSQTYLLDFAAVPPPTDFPVYRMLMTQHARNLQGQYDDYTVYDATFQKCGVAGCETFYNVTEHYRGHSSLSQIPHSYNIDFPADQPLPSEMGFDIANLDLMAQSVDKQHLGYRMFRESFSGTIPTPLSQFVRFHTNPLSSGGTQDYVYINVEDLGKPFLQSEGGEVTPPRFPDLCSGSRETCDTDADCAPTETCVGTSGGDLYRGTFNGDFQYRGTDKDSYRPFYEKHSNVEEDDWTSLIDQCYRMDTDTTPDASYVATIDASSSELEWARWFAIHMLLVNQETGIYRDNGDDYYVYFEPPGSPNGPNTTFIPWDQDSVYGGFRDDFYQETIWRTTTELAQRFVRNNAYAGRFVGAICDLLSGPFTQTEQYARIDAIPSAVADSSRKAALKSWVTARIAYVNAEIVRTLTLTGVPASPYTNSNPVIAISGTLNQCGTHHVLVNGAPVETFGVYGATWSHHVTLVRGVNTITVQDLDVSGAVLDTQAQAVTYNPPCAQDVDCNDNNACNGIETCVATACQSGSAPPAPPEVGGVTLGKSGATLLSWTGIGGGVRYDVASGLLSELYADAGAARAVCLANDLAVATTTDARPAPAPGAGDYYLVRAQDSCFSGTYGHGTGGAELLPANACP
jgi:hypothetical protein